MSVIEWMYVVTDLQRLMKYISKIANTKHVNYITKAEEKQVKGSGDLFVFFSQIGRKVCICFTNRENGVID